MEKHNTLCDATAPSLLSLLEDAPVLKTEVNEQPSTCQSLHSAINQESHQDTNTSNLQQPTAPSSPNQTCNYSCLNISRPSTGSIPRQGSINSGHFNPTAASLHKTRGTGYPRKRLPLTTINTNRAKKPPHSFNSTLDDQPSLLAAHGSTTTQKIGKRSNSNPSRATKTKPNLHNQWRIPHTDPEATRNLWEKVMAGPTSKPASLLSSNIRTSTGNPLFRWWELESWGCEIKKGVTEASTSHFENLVLGTEKLASSALKIDDSQVFWKDVTRTFDRLRNTKAGKAAYLDAIARYFLKEIKPFYESTPDRDQHDEWEAVRLIEHKFHDRNKEVTTQYASMSLPPVVLSGNPLPQSTIAISQSSKNTQIGGIKSVPSSRRPSLSATNPLYRNEDAKQTLKVEYIQGIRPTAVYWLQEQKILLKDQHKISRHTYESDLGLLAPYLTVMIVDDPGTGPNDSEMKAVNNLFVVGSIAVYNRYLLKEKSLQTQSHPWDPTEIDLDLRHYGLVFDQVKFWLWCFKAKVDLPPADDSQNPAQASGNAGSSPSAEEKSSRGKWKGCELEELLNGTLTKPGHVDAIVGSINTIQAYGSRVHGPGIEKDLGRCFAASSAGRHSLSGKKAKAVVDQGPSALGEGT